MTNIVRLRPFDLVLVVVYLIAITLFGLRFREKRGADKSLKSYFLANNTIPWWAIALSIVSAETSTLTIISIPGVAFAGDFGFLQIVLGYMLGRVVVALLFLPRYFAGEMLTAYQLIDRRFGPALHKVTAALFLITRAAAEGVRVFAVSIVVGIAIGTKDVLSIAIISALTLLYTFEGGMAAVIWTDVVQMAIYIGGTFVAIWSLGQHVPGGWAAIHAVAGAAGKFHLFNFVLNLTTAYTFWAGVLGGTFLTMASHGTDQLMVQRMLAARSLRESQAALLSSGVVIFMQFAMFLLIGAGLFVFYGGSMKGFAGTDRIFPTFIVREMPIGVAGLLVAAILAAAMSNLSAALNSLSSTTVVDFYMHLRPRADDRERAVVSKSSTAMWALVLFAIAVATVSVGGKGHVVEIALSIASVAYGCLLGVFLLGTLTKFATELGASIGMVCGFVLNVWLWQGTFPVRVGPVVIPHIAFTWYVLIGAIVTFVIGGLSSLVFRKQARGLVAAMLVLGLWSSPLMGAQNAPMNGPPGVGAADFGAVSALIEDAMANHHLPGAVVVVGHGGKIVFEKAYGVRKLAGEPGLDGQPSPAEPMTEDTIFDMASLTKCLATATSVMQLYEAGKIASFDDPVEKYLPGFNVGHDAVRAKVTLRMLLTHTSGEAPDVDIKDAWGLAAPDKAEGIHRALTTPLKAAPGSVFTYSDINFILLGDLVETLSGETEDVYVTEHVFGPLGMTETRYLPVAKACGPHKLVGAAVEGVVKMPGRMGYACAPGTWSTSLLERIAPTTHDDEGNAQTNPHFDHLTRGTVHDPTTRRMGGVAGHAGVFSTAHDVSLYAAALLEKLVHNTGPFPLKQATLQMMTTPEQPGHTGAQVEEANAASRASIAAGEKPAAPGLAPNYPAAKGVNLRGFGWDIDTGFSKPRGAVFVVGSFGHTGFTGTSLWMDPTSDSYVILLANAIHPRGNPPISNLRGQVATAAAQALHANVIDPKLVENLPIESGPIFETGINVLEDTKFAVLSKAAAKHHNALRLGLLTNQSGVDAQGHRTVDVLAKDLPAIVPTAKLVTIFSPEHGIFGKQDTTSISGEIDPTTGLHVTSLYGAKDSDRRPSHEQLKELDAVVIDLQDVGVHFWTYESVLGYFLEAASMESWAYHHDLDVIVLDRPNPIGGLAVQGPMVDPYLTSYVAYMPLPVRHGLTYGELAQYMNNVPQCILKAKAPSAPVNDYECWSLPIQELGAHLTVVAMQGWNRSMFWSDTGLPWTNPSPNLRSPEAAVLYPGLGLIEGTNLSVGRGTAHPFSFFGAGVPAKDTKTGEQKPAWFKGADVAASLTARHIPGVTFTAAKEEIAEDSNHYPFHGQTIEAVRVTVTDRNVLDTPEMGVEILAVLHKLYPEEFQLARAKTLVCNQATMDALMRGEDARVIAASWEPALKEYRARAKGYWLYQ